MSIEPHMHAVGEGLVGLDECFEKVVEFQKLFENPISEIPRQLNEERRHVRAHYLQEEVEELRAATTLEDQCDALIDIIYFALGGFAEVGVRPHKIFEIVHASNMQKLFADGRPRHRTSDGKVSKPPTWQAPRDLIRREVGRQAHSG
jgi:hypothetical protein